MTRTGEGANGEILRADISSISGNCCIDVLTTGGNKATNLSPTYSPDGRSIAYESAPYGGRTQIYRMDADGTGAGALIPGGSSGKAHSPAWSPDGTKIAFEQEESSGNTQIMVYDLTTQQLKQVTSRGENKNPTWGPDSRHLIFRSTRGGRGAKLYIQDISGASDPRLVDTPGGDARFPAWSPTLGGSIP
jgi:TolB protein